MTLPCPETSLCGRDPWPWRGTLDIKTWPTFYRPSDLSYKLTLSQTQCLQGHSATCISYHCCPKLLTFSNNTSLWNFNGIWEHPLSQTEAFQHISQNIAGPVLLSTDLEGYRTAISQHWGGMYAFGFIRAVKKTLCLSTVGP